MDVVAFVMLDQLLEKLAPSPDHAHWSSLGNRQNTAQFRHAVARLSDTKVLVCGGVNENPPSSSATVYREAFVFDVVTRLWTKVADMPAARADHTAAPLGPGKVLVCGGRTGSPSAYGTTYVYTETTNSWATRASMIRSRYAHSAAAIDDNRVIVVGGVYYEVIPVYTEIVEIYDAITNKWTQVADLTGVKRQYAGLAVVNGSKAVFIGGTSKDGGVRYVNIYDVVSNSWSSGTNMVGIRTGCGAAELTGSRLILVGGGDDESADLIYDVDKNAWFPVDSAEHYTDSYHMHNCVASLGNGKVVAIPSFRYYANGTPVYGIKLYEDTSPFFVQLVNTIKSWVASRM